MIDIIKEHVDNDYFVKITNTAQENICVVTMPSNIFMELPKATTIYEIEDETVSVYRNKQKFLSRKCPNYAKRTVVWAHVVRLMTDRNLNYVPIVLKPYGKEDIILPLEFNDVREGIFKLIEEPALHKDLELELKLVETVKEVSRSNVNTIPKEVLEGFIVSMNTFKGE